MSSENPQLPVPTGSLYELTDHLAALFDTFEGITDPEVRKRCEEDIRRFMEAEIRKVDSVRGYLLQCNAQEEMAKEEAKRQAQEAARWAQRRTRVEEYVISVLKGLDGKPLKGRAGSFSLRACPPSVIITNESQIPEKFKQYETTVTIKRVEIKRAIQANEDVPGADLLIDKKTLNY